jgi:hypothetical protein
MSIKRSEIRTDLRHGEAITADKQSEGNEQDLWLHEFNVTRQLEDDSGLVTVLSH